MAKTKKTKFENLAGYKNCKHKFRKVTPILSFCVKCGFEKWREM